ncbi:type II toxin-antitoxin system VapC family toxin [Mycobacterium shinjukuense]|uniref:type II toxin-antitoxin system VapC family toxin n=1 Tax=Mycobacterium shinjukuense TaxID=398694 RepID=UPI0009F3E653|nr:type II toxin-antitoxin system VapC family toxin [Mycobacterium shinjukuense]MCV6987593.1 type II toxin-antitoxin system VapC family toxin [Mycobacterium shinjukuense]ORB68309.1 VapC toxin family PIN domain ribonuclease [Mycobacterium shinjukuense]
MPIVYFDSSAFVKLLVEEDDSDIAAALWDGCDAAVSSRLAYPEVRAALAAAGRARRMGADEQRLALAMWEEYWAATRAVELTRDVAHRAGHLATAHALGGADAVHLASVLAIGVDGTVFAVWDQRLRTAAQEAAVEVVPRRPRQPTDAP